MSDEAPRKRREMTEEMLEKLAAARVKANEARRRKRELKKKEKELADLADRKHAEAIETEYDHHVLGRDADEIEVEQPYRVPPPAPQPEIIDDGPVDDVQEESEEEPPPPPKPRRRRKQVRKPEPPPESEEESSEDEGFDYSQPVPRLRTGLSPPRRRPPTQRRRDPYREQYEAQMSKFRQDVAYNSIFPTSHFDGNWR